MSRDTDLVAEYREDAGKGASRRLRHAGKVPAILYGAGRPARSLAFDHNALLLQMESERFFSSVLNVKVGDKVQPAILKDVQTHPARRQILHIDLQRIVADEKIRMTVPIHFANEDTAVGVKLGGGSVAHQVTEVEVVCYPKDLPEYLELDIAELELDAMLLMSDIPLPEGVEIPELAQGEGHDLPVVSIHLMRIEEPEEEVEIDEFEEGVEGEGEGEGEAPSGAAAEEAGDDD